MARPRKKTEEETPGAEAEEAATEPAEELPTEPAAEAEPLSEPAEEAPAAEPAAEAEPLSEAEAEAAETVAEVEPLAPEPAVEPEKPKRARAAKPAAKKPAARKPAAKAKKPAERKPIVRLPKPEHDRGQRKERRGVVVSAAMDKTIVVRVDTAKPHPRYKKVVRRSTKFHAHDESNVAKAGDIVRIVETRPLSKTKNWRLAEVVEAAR
jgi:small subunit ribosomal protein S17